jgi:hypothetical protein
VRIKIPSRSTLTKRNRNDKLATVNSGVAVKQFFRLCVCLLISLHLTGCASLLPPWDAQYAEIYIRALDPIENVDVGARIYLGDSGQVLTTLYTPRTVRVARSSFWYPGKVISLVLDAPGYEAAVRLIRLDRWAATPQEAALNANNVDVVLVRDTVSARARLKK